MNDEQREHPRAPISLRVVYTHMDEFFADYTKDMSKEGLFIRSKRPLELGTQLSLVLKLPMQAQALMLKAEVVRVRTEPHPGESAGMGVRLIWDAETDRPAFHAFVEEAAAAGDVST